MGQKYETLYTEAEARICLTCKLKKCTGYCERLKQEKKRIQEEGCTDDQGTAAKLSKN